jgi:aldehyde dehydrogenase (NAD+)
MTSRQMCGMSWQRVEGSDQRHGVVHESVAEAFVTEAKTALTVLYGDNPKRNPDFSRIISAREVTRLAGLIDPAKVVAGGHADPAARYLDPTIVYPVSWDDPIMSDEIFGHAQRIPCRDF